jgi:ubiquinone/menaquinone biosynthesis C-methylase UbiE
MRHDARVSLPPDNPSARVAAVFDRVADTYESVGVPWFVPIAEGLVHVAAPQPGERAVDLGCGRGAALFPLAAAVGPTGHVTGVDLSTRMVELARERADELGLTTVELHVMDAATPALPRGRADLVTASLVLFFLARPQEALLGWAALVRPGGRLCISTFAEQDDAWLRLDALFRPFLPPQMLDARTSGRAGPFGSDEGVADLFAGAGLVDVRTTHADVEVCFADVDAWSRWSSSHGQRVMWEHVPDPERASLVEAAAAILAERRGPDGVTRLSQRVRYTLGRRPPTADGNGRFSEG